MRSAKWRNISSAMKKYTKFTCQGCNCTFPAEELEVHHLTYERLGCERPSDLRVLCRTKCHPIADTTRAQQTQIRRETRQYKSAQDTFLSKKYGDNYQSFADEGMYEEFDNWRAKKRYGETGEW
jgi:hypothetical protein